MLALIVNFTVRAGDEAKAKEYMRIMEEQTRQEPGCQQYIGHQAQEEPRHFMFYELYENEAALEAHRNSTHYDRFVTNGLLKLMETRAGSVFNTID